MSTVAIAEIGLLGPLPSITALGSGVDGITIGTDVTVIGNASLTAARCSLQSNDGISQGGSGMINVRGVYAGGSISGSAICCGIYLNMRQIPDTYAGNTAVQTALNRLSADSGLAVSIDPGKSQSIMPGTYSNLDIKGMLTLSPRLYTINSNVSAGVQGVISGIGVTIVISGTLKTVGGSTLSLSVPTTSPTGSAIPGVLLAGRFSAIMSFLGKSTNGVSGILYFSNVNLKFGGSSSSGSSTYTEIIASIVTLMGTSNMSSSDYTPIYGLEKPGSLPAISAASLMQ
jgi:hypothetical protein